MPKVHNLAKGWIANVGAKTGAAVVHAAKMPTQYILARDSMHVQCDGAMADVKMLHAFTVKRPPGCFSDVLHDILEGNPDLQVAVVPPRGEDIEHLFEYAQATVDADGRQETVYLENLDDDGCLDLRADAFQGASGKNTSWQGPLQHRLCVSMEKDPSFSSPVYSLRSDSPHQWSEHGPGTTSAGLWVTHNNDPITVPSLPPPLLIRVSNDRVKGADCTTPLEAHGEDGYRCWSYVLAPESMDIIDEVRQQVMAAHTKFQWETVAVKPPHHDLYLEDVRGLSAAEVTSLSHSYTAPLPQFREFAMKQLDIVRTSFAGAQKRLHLLFLKLVRLPNESPGPVHRAVQRRLVADDGIFLTSYTLVVGSHAADSTTKGYLVPFSFASLPQPWNMLPFPTVAGESLICPSDYIVRLPGKHSRTYEPLVLIVMGFGTHCVTHRAGYSIVYRGDVSVRKRYARHNTCCACCFITRSTCSTWTTQKTHP